MWNRQPTMTQPISSGRILRAGLATRLRDYLVEHKANPCPRKEQCVTSSVTTLLTEVSPRDCCSTVGFGCKQYEKCEDVSLHGGHGRNDEPRELESGMTQHVEPHRRALPGINQMNRCGGKWVQVWGGDQPLARLVGGPTRVPTSLWPTSCRQSGQKKENQQSKRRVHVVSTLQVGFTR